ncbi:MAG: SAM-dependent methyltransferase [Bacteroidota bacterium]
MQKTNPEQILESIKESWKEQSFVKAHLNNKTKDINEVKSILIRPIVVKNEKKLSFRYRYATKDVVKNYDLDEAVTKIQAFLEEKFPSSVRVFTLNQDLEFLWNKKRILRLRELKASHTDHLPLVHDREKKRKTNPKSALYLHELNITDAKGEVYKNAQSKYKQINHYIEILSSLLEKLPNDKPLKVADMGSGKGYLTFALYDYLTNKLNKQTKAVGIEYRQELIDFCNKVAQKAGFEGLSFQQGAIEDYEVASIDILIALHACDTATDAAIAKGIHGDAQLIVVAPCCHKQIRREIEKNKTDNELNFLTKYGTFLERQAEMVTDGIRALLLNYYGYSTKVLEFVSSAHTPKNVLLIGTKDKSIDTSAQEQILKQIQELKTYFGIGYHQLERLMNIEKPNSTH